jgi:hypothetical protein
MGWLPFRYNSGCISRPLYPKMTHCLSTNPNQQQKVVVVVVRKKQRNKRNSYNLDHLYICIIYAICISCELDRVY